ncbi:MAG TPA: AAA family ATPase, partial [Polyangiaceae bacterium]|nr:AAA family ATPase [Polyangiaceae bacterium]
MKFLRLSVKSFRGIAEAHIDFEPGLNVLFGPNEAGKSTLAEALRAALLCRTQSSAAEAYLPATGSGAPEVALTFGEQSGDWYRIDKTFGDRPSTSLERSANQGQTFVREGTGDGAETELRKRLRWGLRPPGGRGTPRGIESTFLTRTLLAEQTEVDTIFEQGLDPESTEQVSFIQEALAAAMEDPRFKNALALAQRHFKLYFTSNGNKTRGANSPWTRARDQLNAAQTDVDAARKLAEGVAALESALLVARAEAAAARRRLEAAKADRIALDDKLQAAERRLLLVQELEAARSDMEQANIKQRAVEALRTRIDELEQSLEIKTAELEAATTGLRTAREQREQAQAQLQRVESADGNAQRELEVARIESQLTSFRHERDELTRKMANAASLAGEERKLSELRNRIEVQKAALAASTDLEGKATQQITRLAVERTAALIRDADRRLQTARDRAKAAAEEVQVAQTAAEQAEAKGLLEMEIDGQVQTYGDLNGDQVEHVRRLHHDLDKRRSATEAGLSVSIERLQSLEVGTQVDDEPANQHPSSSGRLEVEAKRRVALDLGGLAKLQITAGSSTARAELAEAEAAWTKEGQPLLHHHGVD